MTARHRHYHYAPLDTDWPSLAAQDTNGLSESFPPHGSSSTTTVEMAITPNSTTTDDTTPRQPIPTPTNLDLDFDINFGDTLGFNFSTGSGPSMLHDVAGCSGSRSPHALLSPSSCLEQDGARGRVVSWRKGKVRRAGTEPILSLDITPSLSTNDPCAGPSTSMPRPKPFRSRHHRASSGSRGSGYGSTDTSLSSSDSEQATSGDIRSRPNWGTVLRMTHPFGHVEQRYIPPPVWIPYCRLVHPSYLLSIQPSASPSRHRHHRRRMLSR
ncbi:hypothetical protein SCLCIDRAFT_588791 [Scleroderma citrinum Foug A]|uniref:Uncharacterized protein n=1 Tax=Scleroderma citrinum Foug A TaxID=1036808 RepID=A0A0C3D7E4_9AGAM|nr:hypothetical protein SCLCIDRAFT_588791 [Scleroderma citrinum Foug A]